MNTLSKDQRIAKAGIAIMDYLRYHPDAEDTAEGIAQWWVGEAYDIVEKALNLLVRRGFIEQREELYRLYQQEVSIEKNEINGV